MLDIVVNNWVDGFEVVYELNEEIFGLIPTGLILVLFSVIIDVEWCCNCHFKNPAHTVSYFGDVENGRD